MALAGLRLFAGWALPPDLKAVLGGALSRAPRLPSVKWVPPDNFHLTFHFLGDTPREKLPAVTRALGKTAGFVHPFEVGWGGLGGFPDLDLPKVLFLEILSGRERASVLAADLGRALQAEGFPGTKESFHAHVTLARCKDPDGSREVILFLQETLAPGLPPARVERLTLFESELGMGGSRYKILGEFPLGK